MRVKIDKIKVDLSKGICWEDLFSPQKTDVIFVDEIGEFNIEIKHIKLKLSVQLLKDKEPILNLNDIREHQITSTINLIKLLTKIDQDIV